MAALNFGDSCTGFEDKTYFKNTSGLEKRKDAKTAYHCNSKNQWQKCEIMGCWDNLSNNSLRDICLPYGDGDGDVNACPIRSNLDGVHEDCYVSALAKFTACDKCNEPGQSEVTNCENCFINTKDSCQSDQCLWGTKSSVDVVSEDSSANSQQDLSYYDLDAECLLDAENWVDGMTSSDLHLLSNKTLSRDDLMLLVDTISSNVPNAWEVTPMGDGNKIVRPGDNFRPDQERADQHMIWKNTDDEPVGYLTPAVWMLETTPHMKNEFTQFLGKPMDCDTVGEWKSLCDGTGTIGDSEPISLKCLCPTQCNHYEPDEVNLCDRSGSAYDNCKVTEWDGVATASGPGPPPAGNRGGPPRNLSLPMPRLECWSFLSGK
jgi:hypothetical protein